MGRKVANTNKRQPVCRKITMSDAANMQSKVQK